MPETPSRDRSAGPPVIVLAGGLGTGKTTLLNHVLRHRQDTRVGVLVNDFGDINIDAMLLDGQADSTQALSGGCLCCVIDDGDLLATIDALSAPRVGLDVIVIEASGIADARVVTHKVVDAVGTARFGGAVVLVDATSTPGAEPDVSAADLVVLTKADLAPVEKRDAHLAAIAREAGPVPVSVVRHGALDPGLLFDTRVRPRRQLSLLDALGHEHDHDHDTAVSVSWRPSAPVHPRRLATLLRTGLPQAYRLKGVVRLDVRGVPSRWVIQRVGRHATVGLAGRGTDEAVVAIGPALERDDVVAALDATCQHPGDDVTLDDLPALLTMAPQHLRERLLGAVDDAG